MCFVVLFFVFFLRSKMEQIWANVGQSASPMESMECWGIRYQHRSTTPFWLNGKFIVRFLLTTRNGWRLVFIRLSKASRLHEWMGPGCRPILMNGCSEIITKPSTGKPHWQEQSWAISRCSRPKGYLAPSRKPVGTPGSCPTGSESSWVVTDWSASE